MSAIFISHSSKDNETATELRGLLATQGYHSIFLDFDPEDGIPAGREWEQELYGQLRSCQAVIVLCSKDSMASNWCFAEITHAKALGKNVFPIKVGDCVVNTILTAKQVLDLTKGKDDAYERLWRGLKVLGIDARDAFDWDPKRPPYPGLLAFQEADAAIFFGREPEIQEGLEKLNRLRQFGGNRLLMVLGASGSGKSSLVRAGMIPRLRRDTERWLIVTPFRPGRDPIKELSLSLEQAFQSYKVTRDWQSIAEKLNAPGGDVTASASALIQQVEDLRDSAHRREATVLFFIDQMEELFTFEKGSGAGKLLPLLKAALDTPNCPFMAVGTLRSDFLGQFQVNPSARDLAFGDLRVGPLPAERLSRVVEGPANMAGIRLEDGLTEALMQDTGPDALPLLAFALRELYEGYAADKLLTVNEYRKDLGGLAGSVARAAESVYTARKLSAEEENDLRKAFRAMVRVDDRGAYVRQPASTQNLPPGVAEILERFVQARLLVAGGEGEEQSLEVAHEILFRSWERLRKWLDEDREFLLWKKRLRDAVAGWEKSARDAGALFRGAPLVEAERHLKNHPDALNETEAQFLSESAALRDRLRAEEQQRQQRELEAAKQLAEAQQRQLEAAKRAAESQELAAGRLRTGLVVAVVLIILSLAAGGLAWWAQLEAKKQKGIAEDNGKKAETARGEATREAANALAKEKIAEERRQEAEKANAALTVERSATKGALSRSDRETAGRLSANQEPAAALAYLARSLENDAGNRFALADVLTTALETSWLIPAAAPVALDGEISEVLFSPDTSRILVSSGAWDKDESKWRLYSRSESNELRLVTEIGGAKKPEFSSDGRRIIETSPEGSRTGARWDASNGASVSGKEPVERFSPTSRYRAQFKKDAKPGIVQVVDAAKKPIGAPLYHSSPVSSAWISAAGTNAVTFDQVPGEMDAHLYIWRLGSYENDPGKVLRMWGGAFPQSTRFSSRGGYVALDIQFSGYDGPKMTELYRLDSTVNALTQAVEFFAELRVVDFSADGRFAISGHAQGQLQLWYLADSLPSDTQPGSDPGTADGRDHRFEALAALGDPGHPGEGLDGAALATLNLPLPADAPSVANDGFANPSRQYILFQAEKSWQLWDSKLHRRTILKVPVEAGIDSILFSSDDRWLAFRVFGSPGTPETLHVIELKTETHQTTPVTCQGLTFSKTGQFVLTKTLEGIQVFATATLQLRSTYSHPIQDKLWATEKILALEATPELRGVLTAMGGKRLGASGTMESVPPTEWLRLRSEGKPGASFANAMVRWFLDWPKDRLVPPFQ